MTELFRPGLEGVIAFETEIAEPDREGGALRYRGVDIEELVGRTRSSRSGACSSTSSLEPGMPRRRASTSLREPAATRRPTSRRATARRSRPTWGLRQADRHRPDEQAHDDLARLSAAMLSIVAQSARGPGASRCRTSGSPGRGRRPSSFLLQWRGEADPAHVKAVDTYWICTAEHGLNASTFTARVVASTGADCAAALSAAVGALSGPLHGGAPARVLPMLDGVGGERRRRRATSRSCSTAASGSWASATASTVPRTRAPACCAGRRASSARRASRSRRRSSRPRSRRCSERHPERVLATNVEFWSAVVLDVAEIPPDLTPRCSRCARVAGWSAHILEQKRAAS